MLCDYFFLITNNRNQGRSGKNFKKNVMKMLRERVMKSAFVGLPHMHSHIYASSDGMIGAKRNQRMRSAFSAS
jgi:hypothetical protein